MGQNHPLRHITVNAHWLPCLQRCVRNLLHQHLRIVYLSPPSLILCPPSWETLSHVLQVDHYCRSATVAIICWNLHCSSHTLLLLIIRRTSQKSFIYFNKFPGRKTSYIFRLYSSHVPIQVIKMRCARKLFWTDSWKNELLTTTYSRLDTPYVRPWFNPLLQYGNWRYHVC